MIRSFALVWCRRDRSVLLDIYLPYITLNLVADVHTRFPSELCVLAIQATRDPGLFVRFPFLRPTHARDGGKASTSWTRLGRETGCLADDRQLPYLSNGGGGCSSPRWSSKEPRVTEEGGPINYPDQRHSRTNPPPAEQPSSPSLAPRHQSD
jgi:hypothetical protein